MKVFRATTMIAASSEMIWAILTHAPAFSEWDPNVERIEGRIAAGEKVTAYSKLTPGRAFPATVIEFRPPQQMTWTGGMPFGLFKGERVFTLTPQANGQTRFDIREEFSGPLLGLFAGSLPDLNTAFEQLAAGLKRRAETVAT
jgi:hypothetical protein